MWNNIHCVALHVFDVYNVFFCHFQSGSLGKFDAVLMRLISSLV